MARGSPPGKGQSEWAASQWVYDCELRFEGLERVVARVFRGGLGLAAEAEPTGVTEPTGGPPPDNPYNPKDRPQLPQDLARIKQGDEDGALAFVKRHGFLTSSFEDFEPVWRIWHHARVTRLVLALLEALQAAGGNDDSDLLRDRLRKLIGEGSYELIRRAPQVGLGLLPNVRAAWRDYPALPPTVLSSLYGEGAPLELAANAFVLPEDKASPGAIARFLIRDILNAPGEDRWYAAPQGSMVVQTVGFRDGRFTWDVSFGSLLNAIRWHLQRIATAGEEAEIAICKLPECGNFFVRTNPRALFCPPPVGYYAKESLCGMRYRDKRRQPRKARSES